jgi:hypothetical protein
LNAEEHSQLQDSVIAGITVADLKDRLLSRLQDDLADMPLPVISAEQAAEVGVDVVY